jgi:hypothetical protein
MKTKVFRVCCIAGMPADRTPVISVKKAIVYLPDEFRLKSPSPQGKAQMLAHEILKTEIVNDPEFGNCGWQSQSTEVDLSNINCQS